MNVLDLFSGIGGFSLGLERAGMRTVAFCEIEPFARQVLAKHWPGVPCYDDVRTLTADRLKADGIAADVICGGFPCQDISTAGKGAGIAEGTRSGLWSEYARIIGEVRPRYVVVENVSALLSRGLGRVLGDLAALGYDAEWHCIPASAIGAPHRRDRLWLVAYPTVVLGNGGDNNAGSDSESWQPIPEFRNGRGTTHVADANSAGFQGTGRGLPRGWGQFATSYMGANRQWPAEPSVGRVADGLPNWAHRLKGLGNAVVPQIPEIIGLAIMKRDASI